MTDAVHTSDTISSPSNHNPQPPQIGRDEQLHAWLTQVYPNQVFTHARIPGDASFRGYHRLTVGGNKFIVMDAPPDKESVNAFITVDKLMAGVVHVPTIFAVDETQGFVVLEDLGDTDFADVISNDVSGYKAETKRHYRQAMNEILAIQQINIKDAQAILPYYDEVLLRREMGLFTDWFLPYIGVAFTRETEQLWQDVQADIVKQVTAQPQVVVHRDFHSRNLMILENTDRLGVIDFQDAVIGAYTYDLASLLRDAYIDFDENWVTTQLDTYYQLANIEKSLAAFTIDFNMMSMQRHLKVLGIFVRLFERDGKERYLANLPKVFQDLLACLSAMTARGERNNFDKFDDWLTGVVRPAFDKKMQG